MFVKLKKLLSTLIFGEVPETAVTDSKKRIFVVDVQQIKEQLQNVQKPIDDGEVLKVIEQTSITPSAPARLPFDSPSLLEQFTEKYKDVIFKYILKKLQIAIVAEQPSVDIFIFSPSKKLAKINKNNYEHQLNTMMQYFVKQEDYETASNCRDLIRQLKINDAVDQQL